MPYRFRYNTGPELNRQQNAALQQIIHRNRMHDTRMHNNNPMMNISKDDDNDDNDDNNDNNDSARHRRV